MWVALSALLYKQFFKRFYDVLLSGLALLVLSPVFLLLSVLVGIKLGKPIVYKANRIGKNNKEFCLYKFRSMTNEKDAVGNLLPDAKRLTKFGKALRASSLDELPELVNIFMGHMSIVGPRPLPPIYLPYYSKEEIHRHDIRPGLTGWAQVNGRNSIKWEQKFKFDLDYLNRMSFVFDLKIVLLTIGKVFKREGIGQGEEHPGSLNELRSRCSNDNHEGVN